jgi:polysaccharide export outer membrane protein
MPRRRSAFTHGTTALLLVTAAISGGCTQHHYRVSNLPPELFAPQQVNLQKINLSSLSDPPISREIVQPGDVIEVSMVTDFTKLTATTTPLRVPDHGAVAVPLIGYVRVAGLTLEEAERAIAAEGHARGIFRNPAITVTMKQPRSVRVTVVGAVDEPGVYTLARGNASLMAALVAAGGLAEEAGSEVEIRRGGSSALAGYESVPDGHDVSGVVPAAYHQPAAAPPQIVKVDLLTPATQHPQARQLHDGDVVHVAQQPRRNVYVLGLVRKPGEFEMPPGEALRLLDVIAMAGGASNMVADKVLIVRQTAASETPVNILASIRQAKSGTDNLSLAPGDTVVVEQTPETIFVDALQSVVRFTFGGSGALF